MTADYACPHTTAVVSHLDFVDEGVDGLEGKHS
jgi:hypothetical protein